MQWILQMICSDKDFNLNHNTVSEYQAFSLVTESSDQLRLYQQESDCYWFKDIN